MGSVPNSSPEVIVVTGATGFLGQHLMAHLRHAYPDSCIFPLGTQQADLRDPRATRKAFFKIRNQYGHIDHVYHLAATVSGIGAISKFPASYFYNNLMMGLNVVDASCGANVGKLIVAGSVCAMPERSEYPMLESHLWDGEPEKSNLSYGVAKRVLSTALQAYHQQHKLQSGYILLANLYGPGDNYDPITSHVIPALIHKVHLAQEFNENTVEVWGSGNASRDFLYVEDAASAFVAAGKYLSQSEIVNVGSGEEFTIAATAKVIAEEMGYTGELVFDPSKPDGQKRRILKILKAKELMKWEPETQFRYGIRKSIFDYRERILRK